MIALVGVFSHAAPDSDPDSDGDGLSDYAELHKYFTDPHKANSAGDRKEFTYTITSVLQIAKPFNLADMNDDYQDGGSRLLSAQHKQIRHRGESELAA